ncbi:hypothetical protein N5A93_18690 [Roseovarius sp. EGI FJ00037]|uniref:hypothetical protein n=1 Tax=Roseovarius salincola TaxID=2978479 RepID=UPI0022A8AFEB|nr:hypothetical protein [Roseovarius sp. EGI FJ00037]MCZ0814249.1 hypothetical protein [Roseovarius sp. EGI FJ00037]
MEQAMPAISHEVDAENNGAALVERALQYLRPDDQGVAANEKYGKRMRTFLVNRRSKDVHQWTRTDLKRKVGEVFKELEASGPQLIANAKEHDKQRAVLLLESEMNALLKVLTELSRPHFATGADLFRDLAHQGEASEISVAPRRKTYQNRRSVAHALLSGAE